MDKRAPQAENYVFAPHGGRHGAATARLHQHERSVAMKVKDAMHPGCEWVSPDTKVTEIAQRMKRSDIGAVPIGENDKLIGMVTDRDICCNGVANGHDIESLTARDVMTPGIVWCQDSDDVEDAIELMERRQIRRLPVIDKNKRMIGILSLGDISHAVPQGLTAEMTRAVSAHHR
jgi:CBS domain-containing protein